MSGIPQAFHPDHGADFTSAHLEQVMADLKVRPVYAKKGQPRGHGKIERLIETFNLMCLPHLPGHAPAAAATAYPAQRAPPNSCSSTRPTGSKWPAWSNYATTTTGPESG